MIRPQLIFALVVFAIELTASGAQKDPHWLEDRNTIVHLFEWKFTDIADECERFLSKKGYAGVQVSPVTENALISKRPWWERYQPISYKINTRSGNEGQFLNMTSRCNKVGVRIYVDIVLNHMTGNFKDAVGVAGSEASPDIKSYPAVPYDNSHFHDNCGVDNYQDAANVRNCELVSLRDLNQGLPYVRDKMIELMNKLVDLGAAGFRVDAAKHMWPADLKYMYEHVKDLNVEFGFAAGARPFFYQEVIDLGGEAIHSNEYTDFGTVTEFKSGSELSRVFSGNDKLKYLDSWGPGWGLIPKSGDALVFIDNHDTQRQNKQILTYKNSKRYKMAIAFMLAHPYGVSRIMSSYDFNESDAGPPADKKENIISPGINPDDTCTNGWICEHRWRQIYNMVGFKNAVRGTEIKNWWSNDDQQIAFCRGNKGFVAFTNYGNISRDLQTCLPVGIYCDVITGNLKEGRCTGKTVSVNKDGFAYIDLSDNVEDGVLAIHLNSRLPSKL